MAVHSHSQDHHSHVMFSTPCVHPVPLWLCTAAATWQSAVPSLTLVVFLLLHPGRVEQKKKPSRCRGQLVETNNLTNHMYIYGHECPASGAHE